MCCPKCGEWLFCEEKTTEIPDEDCCCDCSMFKCKSHPNHKIEDLSPIEQMQYEKITMNKSVKKKKKNPIYRIR